MRIELNRQAAKGRNYKDRLTNGQQEIGYQVIFEYQEFKGKMYLKYQKEEDTWHIFEDSESKNILFTKHPKKELFVNKIIVDNLEDYPFVQNLQRDKSIEAQAKQYNSNFWKYYKAPTRPKSRVKSRHT